MTDKSVDSVHAILGRLVASVLVWGQYPDNSVEEAKIQLRELFKNKIPEKIDLDYTKSSIIYNDPVAMFGYNQAITETTKAIEEVLK